MSQNKNSELLNAVGNRIAKRRIEMNLTQEELAEKADTSVGVISSAERGTKSIRIENLIKLSEALDVSTDYLLKGTFTDMQLNELSLRLKQLPSAQIEKIKQIIYIYIDMCND